MYFATELQNCFSHFLNYHPQLIRADVRMCVDEYVSGSPMLNQEL